MSLYFIVSSLIIVVYLTLQTMSDIKTKKVYTNLNYAAMLVIGLMYIVKCVALGGSPQIQCLIGGFLFIVIHSICLKSVIGTGDAKALVVIYYQSSLLYDNSFTFDIFYPVFIYFVANIFFTIYVVGNGIKKKKKIKDIFFGKEKRAFFPYLSLAYVINLIFIILSTPT